MKIAFATALLAGAAFTTVAFADDTAPTPPAQAAQAWQQLSPEQKQAIMADQKEKAMAKKEAWTQLSAEEKAAKRQEAHRQMEMRHERHEHRRELRHRISR